MLTPIKRLIASSDLTLDEIVARSGLPESTVYRLYADPERGQHPTADTIRCLAKVFGELAWVVFGYPSLQEYWRERWAREEAELRALALAERLSEEVQLD